MSRIVVKSQMLRKMAIRNANKTLKWKMNSQKPQATPSFSTIPNLTHAYLDPKPQTVPSLTHTINLLLPRLCLSDHLATAIHLITAALTLPNPPHNPDSLSLPILVHSLTLQPDLKLPMSLLNRIPRGHPYVTPISTMLIASFLKKGRPKDALKVYKWMLRPGSPYDSMVDKSAYGVLVGGLCGGGLVLEGLMVLRDMLRVHLLPGEGLRKRVVGSLLREARVREAMALDRLLPRVRSDGGLHKVLDLLDNYIGNWSD
ncbi:Tetratricopeptide repeat (TPR)-like superfamily protein [Hibiscus syriacus]|uniref:Tetratricopeptide repeat (TPR)-like superfamily protein n=1 Tax=Hibiscus syriacus TaxID=106335 RepID=A0A6A2Y1P8_HIBSY|nr:pentatricopeptide repeat-containing protein At1g12775, mitochondrial-like [Hibiscus syriacus]XP_039042795.1 pentatricopeptide repeat-containing protein At1g12775, mitochondrial-like [Hibiscus syriacus]KAE8665609.1 Tetratricopeptide repeat (TPR)-like superfamily protein [Hibiscus syriacus]